MDESQPRESMWEFNAPQFVDFSAPTLNDDDDADAWFDSPTTTKVDNPIDETYVLNELTQSTAEKERIPLKSEENTSSPMNKEVVKKKLSNVCSSLEEWNKKKTVTGAPHKQVVNVSNQDIEVRRSPRIKPEKNSTLNRAPVKVFSHSAGTPSSTADQAKKSRRSEATPLQSDAKPAQKGRRSVATPMQSDAKPAQKGRRSVATPLQSDAKPAQKGRRSVATPMQSDEKPAQKGRRSVPNARTVSASSIDGGISTGSNDSQHHPHVSKIPKLTIPNTPLFMKRPTQKSQKGKTTEQLEMEKIEQYKKQLAEKRKLNQDSYRRGQAATRYAPVRSTAGLTRPQEFHFATDSRVKSHDTETNNNKEKDFNQQLRKHPESPLKAHHGITVCQPFNLSGNRKRKLDQADNEGNPNKYVSMAEAVLEFQKDTPDRFRSRVKGAVRTPSRGKSHSPGRRGRSNSPKLTIAKTPKFEAKNRKRPITAVSYKEQEEKEVEEIKKFQFKANPVDERIFHNPNMGIKKVTAAPVTEPITFAFETDRRLRERDQLKVEDVVNSSHSSMDSYQEELKRVKAHPVPHVGIPFQPKLNHKCTVPAPFDFERRDKELMAKKEDKINQIIEEEMKAHEFHAQPLPCTPAPLPTKRVKSPTQTKTPRLRVDQRGAMKAEKWSKEIEEELKQQRALATFKAKSNKVVYEEPFVPKKSNKPLTDVSEFKLNTVCRSKQREEFELYKKEKQHELDAIAEERQRQQDEEEQRLLAKLRNELVHKPNPIKHYKSVEVLPSDKTLTQPKTPRFSERLKNKIRM